MTDLPCVMPSEQISLLPAIMPLLGAALALNLAYLNLPAFGYIKVVRGSVSERLARLDASVIEMIKNTQWYRQMSALAKVPTLGDSSSTESGAWVETPRTLWGLLFNFLFYWRLGRGVSIALTGYVTVLFILGTGHAAGVNKWFIGGFGAKAIAFHFVASAVAMLWPILVVLSGQFVCWRAARFISYQTANLKEETKSRAEELIESAKKAVSEHGAA
jgi:hypothetical protein